MKTQLIHAQPFRPSFGVGGCYGENGNPFGPGTSHGQGQAVWSAKRLRILERSGPEMKDLAEYFHDYDKAEIEAVASEAHFLSSSNAEKAARKLFGAVQELKARMARMSRPELARLAEKAAEKFTFKVK